MKDYNIAIDLSLSIEQIVHIGLEQIFSNVMRHKDSNGNLDGGIPFEDLVKIIKQELTKLENC